ncbi:MAG: hypothetical protein ABI162_10980 [Luteolibacter sp.]
MPLISALAASAVPSANAEVAFSLSTNKVYRQSQKGIAFTGGSFNSYLYDGNATYIGGCSFDHYVSPGVYTNICSPGTSGLVTSGVFGKATLANPYLLVVSVIPAIIIEPKAANYVSLNAAPASGLPRPSGGFKDDSKSLFYNLHTADVKEYVLSAYYKNVGYTDKQREKFENEIVPGVYHYSFPRLHHPTMPAPLTAVIYPMLEGLATKNNKTDGFEFTTVGQNKWMNGFMEFSFRRPNVVKWRPVSPTVVFPAVDKAYIALREMQNPSNPKSEVLTRAPSIFPPYVNGSSNSRVVLSNAFVNSFTFPPTLHSGTRGILEVEMERSFATGGVTYDFSNRRFQIPVKVVDRYSDYAIDLFSGSKLDDSILADPDKDGYNNLTEWILDSTPTEAFSIPIAPTPAAMPTIVDPIFGNLGETDFGFTIDKKLGTFPRVVYTLQRSTNNGLTWKKFVSDANWSVENVSYTQDGSKRSEIRVRSLVESNPLTFPATFVQPPGTEGDIYRVKVVLAK